MMMQSLTAQFHDSTGPASGAQVLMKTGALDVNNNQQL